MLTPQCVQEREQWIIGVLVRLRDSNPRLITKNGQGQSNHLFAF
jgi:hypothetical protein